MLGHFPIPYPDELFYSICARFSDRVRYPSLSAVLKTLWGTTTISAIVGLPGHLAYLVAHLPLGYPATADTFIYGHTLLPFYAPFLLRANLSRLYAEMCGTPATGMQGRATAATGGLSMPDWFRFCPACVEGDREQWGEAYWHRVHQISGLEVCPTHAVFLEPSAARLRYRERAREFVSAERAIRALPPRPLDLSNRCHQILLELARDADWLLRQNRLPSDLETLQKRYVVALIRQKSATPRGHLLLSELWREFRASYPPALLRSLHGDLDERITPQWLSHLVHDPHTLHHPLHHMLMIHFLGYSLSEFLSGGVPSEYRPFGEAPWPCLNPASGHYRQPVIAECHWTYQRHGRWPVGTFACPLCGFVYTRTGPDQSPEDRFRRSPSLKACGPVWEAELGRLWDTPHTSLKQIGRQLGIGSDLVRKYAADLELPVPRPRNCSNLKPHQQLRRANPPSPTQVAVEEYREKWLTFLKEHPEARRSQVTRANGPVFRWLRRNDLEWLESHLLPRSTRRGKPERANWAERDRQLVIEVEQAATGLRARPGCPVQLSLATLGRATGKLVWLYNNLAVLPLTASALRSVVETHEEWGLRKVTWAVEQYRLERLCPTRTDLMKRAGVGYNLAHRPRLRTALDTELHRLSGMETGDESAGV